MPENIPAPGPAATPAAPAAPVAPAPTATDNAPAPAASLTPNQPSPEEAAQAAEDKDWGDAAKEVFPGHKQESGKDGEAKSGKDGQTPKTNEQNPAEKKPDAKPGDGDDAKSKGQDDAPKDALSAAREARALARQSAEQTQALISDVRTKMFADVPTELKDADGDPIKTISDVQKLINPRTGEAFTEEEAGMWLISATQQFNQNLAKTEKQIEEIAQVNVAIKEEADYINSKYGELLKSDTALRDRLWAQYEKTLVKDEASGIITKMPVSLEEFYDMALSGRVEAQQAAPAPQPGAEAGTKTIAEQKEEADRTRQQRRADRADIYSPPGAGDLVDPETKEWADAANAVFGDRLKR